MNQIPGCGSQRAAVYADVAQGAVIQFGEIGKSFDHAAVLGPIHPAAKTGHFTKGAISLAVNGTVRQNADLDKMIWSVAEQISKLSEAFELKAATSSIPARLKMSARQ